MSIDEMTTNDYLKVLDKALDIIKKSEKRLTIQQLAGKIKVSSEDMLTIIYDLQSDNQLIDLLPDEDDKLKNWEVEYYGD